MDPYYEVYILLSVTLCLICFYSDANKFIFRTKLTDYTLCCYTVATMAMISFSGVYRRVPAFLGSYN
jgi:hypothetical protein